MQDSSDLTAKKAETAANIRTWMIDQIAEQLGVQSDEIDPTVPITLHGLNSAQTMSITTKAEALVGQAISPILFWHYPTIVLLADRLAEEFADLDIEFRSLNR